MEEIHKAKCKDCNCFLENENVNNNLIKYKWLFSNKDYSNKINEELKKKSLSFLTMISINLFCC